MRPPIHGMDRIGRAVDSHLSYRLRAGWNATGGSAVRILISNERNGDQAMRTAVEVRWDDAAESVVRLDVQRDYTWDEFHEAVSHIGDIVGEKPYRCDIIVQLGRWSAESSGIPAIQKALGAIGDLPQNVGLVVIVVGGLAGMLLNAAKRIDSRVASLVRTVSSLDKARRVIADDRGHEE